MMGAYLQLKMSPSVLLVALTLFMKGALALECHSCVDLGDGGCSQQQMKKLTCPSNVHVCVETVAAVEWSHGKFSVGEKGCGLGMPGTNDKAVEVHGILAFSQLHQCNTSLCNIKLDMKELQLQPMDNVSAQIPNGVECYSCEGDNCTTDNSTIVKCYDNFRGCFHGNVTMKAGNFSLTKPIKGCVQDGDCTKVRKGSPAITLSGSCCSGNLCNTNLSNKTHFSTSIPRLAFLPAQETKNATVTTPSTYVRINAATAAASTSGKLARSLGVSPSVGGPQKDHSHDHGHDHDHDHSHEEDENNTVVQNRKVVPSVNVEERHVGGPKGGVTGLQGSALVTFLLLGLCL
ncbi:ly6/PLAUR domain-containing protein 3-like [Pseudonaja textilis]|uniref:ly6/PLAUR domain-containing protein 3-like n=1 Tax=Pseudonaja textilis TaxID=8673 RepID=UPI000EA949BA|nr:ly6/PLAUR domain-containing protein 3-like [Pseudonaja textilis]